MTLAPEWRVEPELLPYAHAVATMEDRVAAIRAGTAPELVWLVEHPPLYTAGTSAEPHELLSPDRFPVFATGRGGKYTYHGPGQRIAYVMLDLDARGRDLRAYVAALEGWIIAALADLGVAARVIPGKIGVWTDSPAGAAGTSSSAGAAGTSSSAGAAGTSNSAGPAKIAAIGVRVRRWVSYHGLAINVAPDLAHFDGIVPCGLSDPVTSLSALGRPATLADVDAALARHLPALLAKLGQA